MLATLKKFKIGDFGRGLEGFRTRVAVQFQSTGIGELDQVLGGGFPRGSVVEFRRKMQVGPGLEINMDEQACRRPSPWPSSGREYHCPAVRNLVA